MRAVFLILALVAQETCFVESFVKERGAELTSVLSVVTHKHYEFKFNSC